MNAASPIIRRIIAAGALPLLSATALLGQPLENWYDKEETVQDVTIRNVPQQDWNLFERKVIRMGVLLPFTAESQASLDGNMDFYFGVLMAARELGNEGISLDVDTRDYSLGSFHYLSMRDEDDFVLGPLKNSHLGIAKSVLCPGTILVSPLDHRAAALSDSCFIQGASVNRAQWEEAIRWEFEDGDRFGTNYIVVRSDADSATFHEARACLQQAGVSFRQCVCDASHDITGWEDAYVEGMPTCIILAISNEAALNNAIRNMGILTREAKDIRIYAGSKVTSYRTIPVEDIHKIGLRVVCPYFIDYSDPATLAFIHAYRALFNAEPTQFSFQGHDLAYFIAKARHDYGADWIKSITELPQTRMLQSDIMIRPLENGGLANFGMRRVVYAPDFEVILQWRSAPSYGHSHISCFAPICFSFTEVARQPREDRWIRAAQEQTFCHCRHHKSPCD